MTNSELLKLINQENEKEIYLVIGFSKNEFGFFDVEVLMENSFYEKKSIVRKILQFPKEKVKLLSEIEIKKWFITRYNLFQDYQVGFTKIK
jgi:hypothetical protein